MQVLALLAVVIARTAALTISDAKMAVSAALAANDGQTKAPAVAEAVEALAALNPTVAPARASTLFGSWKQINSPE